MNRIDRLTALLIMIQSRKRTAIEVIEERFDLSRRTIFRDIKALIETGVPIGGDSRDGYFIVDGYHLPPVVFNKEEAASLLLGAKFIERNTDAAIQKNIDGALEKVKSVIRIADREFLEDLEESVTIMPTKNIAEAQDFHLSDIQFAIASKRTIEYEYRSNYKQEVTNREVEPLGLVYYLSNWHLIAYCQLRKGMRDFRTDRIIKLKITENTFDVNQHPNYLDFLNESLSGTDAKIAWLRFTKKMARFLGDQKYYFGYAEEAELEDCVRMKFITPKYEFLARWMMSYGDQVTVEEPQELKQLAQNYARELYEHYR